jgi:crossover junction endodeoxyribonuclease RuvC
MPPMGITAQQFKQMQDRLGGSRRVPSRVIEKTVPPAARTPQVILGLDPSLRGTGFGVIRLARPCPVTLVHGTISCPATWERSRCLAKIAQVLRDVLREHQPAVCVVEGLFYAQNLQTALIMGEARGAALSAIAEAGLEIYELAPRKVKQAIVGYGAAQKMAVAKMVQRMLRLVEMPAPDAADALALALAHVQGQGRLQFQAARRI